MRTFFYAALALVALAMSPAQAQVMRCDCVMVAASPIEQVSLSAADHSADVVKLVQLESAAGDEAIEALALHGNPLDDHDDGVTALVEPLLVDAFDAAIEIGEGLITLS